MAFFGLGVFVLMQILSPVVAFKVWEITSYDSSQLLVDPLSLNGRSNGGVKIGMGEVLGISIKNKDNFPAFVSSNSQYIPYPEFKITIPKLKIDQVIVKVSSNDFEKNLAHLSGTALPGERGNVFISGHSSISRELTLKGAKAYFSRLQDLKKGEKIEVLAVGQKYQYEVIGTRIVDPKEVQVINPPDSEGRYLTLMTCVPPGFNTKRLIVLAKLIEG